MLLGDNTQPSEAKLSSLGKYFVNKEIDFKALFQDCLNPPLILS